MARTAEARRVLTQLALDVLVQVHRAAPRSHLVPFLETAALLATLGLAVAGRLTRSPRAAALGAAAGASLAVVVTLTLLRGGYDTGPSSGLSSCVLTVPDVASADGASNLLLLAPTALLCVLAVGRPGRVVLGAAAVSLLVEVSQAVLRVGVCDSSDAVLNTLGASAAAATAVVLRRAARPRHVVPGSGPCPGSS